ncbi:MAG: Thymidylate kinase [uncultured bacterium]|nr:MAG: Thymidylate kinase [uncultured bacterium]HBY01461.1 dTMP kinase [Rikenellaceae bacterium]
MLIVLEGLDGAGKSTQINLLQKYFESSGAVVKYLHFPRFDSPVFGDLIARFLRGDLGSIDQVHPYLIALLFAGDRREAGDMIREWLKEGYCVILDRYLYSNIAFQCAKVKDLEEAENLRDWIFDTEYIKFAIPKPDLNLFLDVPLNFVHKKLNENRKGGDREYLQGKRDIHEASIEFQSKVRDRYLKECKRDTDFVRIDCADINGNMLPASDIFSLIKNQFKI